ncbi:hypothetical protein GJ744_007596 [Endocarpon pusillum]|uniref:Uncharacterized protein n=1 Tax=Endocarpon pusillum TaxID=364733 RepID=A0A8H7E601_9EURO|nr:hypothetical protein GJ744_007596 [Endocarpon pusillum]
MAPPTSSGPKKTWILVRVAKLHAIVQVKREQSLRLWIDRGVARCDVSIHNTVSEVDLVDDLSHLSEPGKMKVGNGVIVFQSPSRDESAGPSN